MPTRTIKLEITGLSTEERQLLYSIGEQLRRVANWAWRRWETYHTIHNTPDKLQRQIEQDKRWRSLPPAERKTTKRPAWSIDAMPKELYSDICKESLNRAPDVNNRCCTNYLHKWRKNLITKKSSAANCKWWIAILLDLDGRGIARHNLPIPIDSQNAKITPSDEPGQIAITFRADRIARPNKVRATSTQITARIKVSGKKTHYAQPAIEMANGLRNFTSAELIYDNRQKKWFISIAYDVESKTIDIDPNKTAILRPGKKNKCWVLRVDGKSISIAGSGKHVAHKRKSLLSQRLGRQHSYRYAPPRKGKGLQRALTPLYKLTSAWNNFTKSCNNQMTAQLCEILADRKVGKLILLTGDDTRLLATIGKIPGQIDSTGWPWYQAEQYIKQKLSRFGIQCTVQPMLKNRIARLQLA